MMSESSSEGRSFPRRLPWILLCAGILSAALAFVLAVAEREVVVEVRSDPAGATLFEGPAVLGLSPLEITLPPRGERRLRLVRKGCEDGFLTLRANDFRSSSRWGQIRSVFTGIRGHAEARLAQRPTASLAVASTPAGASVFLDGQLIGITPLTREELTPGERALRIEHPDCFPDTLAVTLTADRETRLDRRLNERVVALYRDMIAKQPGSLMHRSDLAHHYVLRGDYANAEVALRDCLEAVKRPDASDANQFFWELAKIYTRWFSFPETGEMKRIRPLCRELMETARDKRIGDPKTVERYLQQLNAYDQSNPPK